MPLDGMHMNGRAHGVIDKHVFQVNEIIQIVQEEQVNHLMMVHGVTKEKTEKFGEIPSVPPLRVRCTISLAKMILHII